MASRVLVRDGRVLLRNGLVALEGCAPECCGDGCEGGCCLENSIFCGDGGALTPTSWGLEYTFTETMRSRIRTQFGLGIGAATRFEEFDRVFTSRRDPVTCAQVFTCVSWKWKAWFRFDSGDPDYVIFDNKTCASNVGSLPYWRFISSTIGAFTHIDSASEVGSSFSYNSECAKIIPLVFQYLSDPPVSVGTRLYSYVQTCKSVSVNISNPDWSVEYSPGNFVVGGVSMVYFGALVITKACDGSEPAARFGGSDKGCPGCGDGGASGIVLPTLAEIQSEIEKQRNPR